MELTPDALHVLTPNEVDHLTTGLYDALNRFGFQIHALYLFSVVKVCLTE